MSFPSDQPVRAPAGPAPGCKNAAEDLLGSSFTESWMSSAALSVPAFRLRLPEVRHWMGMLVLATAACLYLLAGLSLAFMDAADTANARPNDGLTALADLRSPPRPEPLRFRDVPPQDAVAINAAVPVSGLANPSANAFLAAF